MYEGCYIKILQINVRQKGFRPGRVYLKLLSVVSSQFNLGFCFYVFNDELLVKCIGIATRLLA